MKKTKRNKKNSPSRKDSRHHDGKDCHVEICGSRKSNFQDTYNWN